jgi:SAM-dependent methyltransferase
VDLAGNADRFSGFADLYDRVRPTPPLVVGDLIREYCGVAAPVVVDLGSGTGLSTRWAAAWAGRVVGVEPSDDMRAVADAHAVPRTTAVAGWSHATGLPDGSADAVLAVQALHWMEPTGTFAEVARVLRPGGVFAALDCDWPPAVGSAAAEEAWGRCMVRAAVYEDRLLAGLDGEALAVPPDLDADGAPVPEHLGRDHNRGRALPAGVTAWSKDEHLGRMRASGRFRFCREVALHAVETGDAARFVDLLRSQGGIRTLAKHGLDETTIGVTAFAATVHRALGDGARPFVFTYRMRLAVR